MGRFSCLFIQEMETYPNGVLDTHWDSDWPSGSKWVQYHHLGWMEISCSMLSAHESLFVCIGNDPVIVMLYVPRL